MKLQTSIGGKTYEFDSIFGYDLSIPLDFSGDQVSLFGAEAASVETWQLGDFVGDTKQGGSCNVQQLHINPQCNGTHTESVGHIVHEDVHVTQVSKDAFIPSTLISVAPVAGKKTKETYLKMKQSDDLVITAEILKTALSNWKEPGLLRALMIRTLPNDESKKTRAYSKAEAVPYFTSEAMQEIIRSGVEHLLVDFPSIDRMDDEGKLNNHHLFWDVTEGMHSLAKRVPSHKTVTELIYVPDEVKDGYYMLDLQMAPFLLESAPSRPLVYSLTAV